MPGLFQTEFENLKLLHRGKVRDIYDLGEYLMFVASDRISAFDVIMNEPVDGKGSILSSISAFWFDHTGHIIPNHMVSNSPDDYPEECKPYSEILRGRSMLVKKCKPLPIEAVVRGYIAGSGWKEYKSDGTICGIKIAEGLPEFGKLPDPIFTPATKEETGHDININFETTVSIIGEEVATKVRETAIALYKFGWEYMDRRGIILADTKFEFGFLDNGELILIDEAMTPDSSRFWLKEKYSPGKPQYNFDKQILRDYLESIPWNKQYPPPELPDNIIAATLEKYKEAYFRIVGTNNQE